MLYVICVMRIYIVQQTFIEIDHKYKNHLPTTTRVKKKTDMKNKTELIFLPSPGIGHLASTLELAQLLINHDNHNLLSITILCIKFQFTPFEDSYIKSVLASSQPQIKLIDLPEVEPPKQDPVKSHTFYMWSFMQSLKPHFKKTTKNILSSSNSNSEVVLVLDFFCVPMIDVGKELGIPSFLYLTSNMGFLGFMFSLQNRQINNVFCYSDRDLLIPGISIKVPSKVLPDSAFNRDGGYVAYYKLSQRLKDTKGIIVNTFSELENYAIDALLSDDDKTKTPPIYSVGPLIDLKCQHNPNSDQTQHDKIMKWLDEQPHSSVVFLCFGSMGRFGPSQTREIALGLQCSGVKFLWAMHSPRSDEEDGALPKGFLEWMEEGKGMICKWAPQVEILAHKAIGGFVSHCGWNSILESLWFGVPILTWPIYAEQQLNAFRMVKEFGLAVELKLDYRNGSDLVMADEIEKGLKQLMDRDNIVHKKVKEIKELARNAVLKGGSSFISVGKLIDSMISSN